MILDANYSNMLKQSPNTFKGGISTLNIKPIHLELKSGTKPYHVKSVPDTESLQGDYLQGSETVQGYWGVVLQP